MSRVESILDYTASESNRTRIGQQLVGLWMFRDHPVTGVGPGNFEENVKRYADRVPDRWRVEVIGAHNLYVEVLAELGVQGLVLMLLILVYAWRAARQLRRRAPTTSTALLYEALGASLVVFAFSALFVHAQYQKEWWLLLAVITTAYAIAHVQAARSEPGSDPTRRRRRRTIAGSNIQEQVKAVGGTRRATTCGHDREPKV